MGELKSQNCYEDLEGILLSINANESVSKTPKITMEQFYYMIKKNGGKGSGRIVTGIGSTWSIAGTAKHFLESAIIVDTL